MFPDGSNVCFVQTLYNLGEYLKDVYKILEKIFCLFYHKIMKLISRIILLFCIFFITLSANVFCSSCDSYLPKNIDTISAVKYYNYDLINSKDNESVLSNINRNDSTISNNKDSNDYYSGLFNKNPNKDKQFKELLSYLYTISYLDNKTKISFLSLLSEIHPNAP